jgi:2-keto-4-pentenoate hydratase
VADIDVLTAEQVEDLAASLHHAAESRQPLAALAVAPIAVADGYRVQAAGHARRGSDLVAWKAGCTSEAAQQMLGVDTPVFGRYEPADIRDSEATIVVADLAGAPHLEVEVGLRLIADLPTTVSSSTEIVELARCVEAFAAVEVVASRIAAFPFIDAGSLIADNVAGSGIVVGEVLPLDADGVAALASTPVTLVGGGHVLAESTGAAALGHPLRVLSALMDHASSAGVDLSIGDLLITGTCTGLLPAEPGVDYVAHVGDATVTVRFE